MATTDKQDRAALLSRIRDLEDGLREACRIAKKKAWPPDMYKRFNALLELAGPER